jgi:tRNA-2-methylthio-N6-dimethylallyladenosine synthase
MDDDVPDAEKRRRHQMLEELQARIVGEINAHYLGKTVEVLVEDQHKGKWRGRTPQNKLVFFEDDTMDWRGKLAEVEITWTGPWSMQGRLPGTLGTSEAAAQTGNAVDSEVIPLTAI